MRFPHAVLAAVLALTIGAFAAPSAHAEPSDTPSISTPVAPSAPADEKDAKDQKPEPGIPLQVPSGSFGYIATRSATKWLAARTPAVFIKHLPVPPELRKANSAMAKIIELELASAVETPGACVQIIVTPAPHGGGLFSYGFFAVAPEFCPS